MSTFSESSILELLATHFPEQHPSLLLGRGDDCAVLREQNGLCVSTDLFIEDVHFRKSYFSPQDVGYKALAVNISDLAAMGVRPLGFSMGLAIPASLDIAWLNDFFSGMASLAKRHNMALSGGDISRSEKIVICITVWGEGISPKQLGHGGQNTAETTANTSYNVSDSTGKYLTRGGAMPGDILFLIGHVGLARIGLEELEKNEKMALEKWPCACAAHLQPQPQVDAGLILARSCTNTRPPVLMDVSDGLASDIPRLLGMDKHSILGAQLLFPKALLHDEVLRHAALHKRNAVQEAWLGGEDYALLGACVPTLFPIIHAALPQLRSIGTVTDDGIMELNSQRMPQGKGFDHFHHQYAESKK